MIYHTSEYITNIPPGEIEPMPRVTQSDPGILRSREEQNPEAHRWTLKVIQDPISAARNFQVWNAPYPFPEWHGREIELVPVSLSNPKNSKCSCCGQEKPSPHEHAKKAIEILRASGFEFRQDIIPNGPQNPEKTK